MTTATIIKSKTVRRVTVKGHSGYAKINSDIVCSSISSIMFLTFNIVSKLTKDVKINVDERNVYMDIEFTADTSEAVNVVMNSLVEALEDISMQYPKNLTIKYNS